MLHIVSFFEFVYTAACVDKFLLAGKERVAFVADIHFERFNVLGGTRFKCCTAGAYNRYFMISGMYIGLHFIHLALVFNAKLLYIILRGQSIKNRLIHKIICPPQIFLCTFTRAARLIFCLLHKSCAAARPAGAKIIYNLVAFIKICEYN